MGNKYIMKIAAVCMATIMAFAPVTTYASTLLKVGSRGTEVKNVQTTLKTLGYFTYPKATGYYGSITASAVKRYQRDKGISVDGIYGKITKSFLYPVSPLTSFTKPAINLTPTLTPENSGAMDWFTQVRNIWGRGINATVTDVNTGKSFEVKRTYGTNHADVETLTVKDTEIMKQIWGGFSWERRAVIVRIGLYTLAGSMTAMPHAGLENKPEGAYVSGRSDGYGWGYNYDAVKGNAISGHMDIHFKNSRTHGTNIVQQVHQNMVQKAANYIASLSY